jgi:phosphatidylinositol-3-phosphatase
MQRSTTGRVRRCVPRVLLAGVMLVSFGLTGDAASRAAPAVEGAARDVVPSPICTGKGRPPVTWSHITLIMFENKPLRNVIGNTTDAPYLNRIASACSYSVNTQSMGEPSLKNYVALTSGYRGCKEVVDDEPVCNEETVITSGGQPSEWPQPQNSIFQLMNEDDPERADSAIEWAEDMPANCYMSDTPKFMIRHSPYQYYINARSTCQKYARPFPAVPARVLSAKFNLVIPNKIHIMHRPGVTSSEQIQDGDNWLKGYLPTLLSSRRYQGGKSAIIITWDEGNEWVDTVPLIVVTPYTTPGGVSDVPYTHYSTLKGIQRMLGQTTLLGHAADTGRSNIRRDPLFRLR